MLNELIFIVIYYYDKINNTNNKSAFFNFNDLIN